MADLTAEELQNIAVGDVIEYQRSVSYDRAIRKAIVTKVTVTQIITKDGKFRRSNGSMINTDRFDFVSIVGVRKHATH